MGVSLEMVKLSGGLERPQLFLKVGGWKGKTERRWRVKMEGRGGVESERRKVERKTREAEGGGGGSGWK